MRRVISSLLFFCLTTVAAANDASQRHPITAPANIDLSDTPEAPIKINDLIEHSHEFDGRQVTITGEAIGDLMDRGKISWLNISDPGNAIGVYGPPEMFAEIKHLGRYRHRGDSVRITGIFHRSDPEQGGDLVIAASQLEVIRVGAYLADPVGTPRIIAAIFAALVAGLLMSMVWRGREGRPSHKGDGGRRSFEDDLI